MPPGVGELVAEDVLQPPGVLHPLRQHHGGPQHPQQQGAGCPGTHHQGGPPRRVQPPVDLPGGGGGLPLPLPHQPGEAAVAQDVPTQTGRCPQAPHYRQRQGQVQGGAAPGPCSGRVRLRRSGRSVRPRLRPLWGGGRLCHGRIEDQGRRLRRGLDRRAHGSRRAQLVRRGGGHRDAHPEGQAQPQQHRQPQVVAQGGTEPPPEEGAQQEQGRRQQGPQQGEPSQGQEEARHVPPPPSPSHSRSNRSRSSATSSRSKCSCSTREATRSRALPA